MSKSPVVASLQVQLLLVILATDLKVTLQNECLGGYQYLGINNIYSYLLPSSPDKTLQSSNISECSLSAFNNDFRYFCYNSTANLCKVFSSTSILTITEVHNSNKACYFRYTEWIKVYELSMRAGSQVYNSFVNNGNHTTWKVDKCNGQFCPKFFRHPILDIWGDLQIEEVKVVIYKNKTAVVNMVFDGHDTTITSWFSKKHLKSSPWTDTDTVDFFSLEGYSTRRFFIVKPKTCAIDSGWLVILEANSVCNWTVSPHYPVIFYSTNISATTWDKGHGTADSFAIFLRLKTT